MDVQWWIDAAGKIGSASVAAAVFIATLAQNRWVNRVARRSARVEDQKMRLALLERRIAVLDDFDRVRSEWTLTGHVSTTVLDHMQKVVIAAEIVFPEEVERLMICRQHLFRMRSLDRLLNRENDSDDARNKNVADAIAHDEVLREALDDLRAALVAEAKVGSVPELPPSLLDRLFGIKA